MPTQTKTTPRSRKGSLTTKSVAKNGSRKAVRAALVHPSRGKVSVSEVRQQYGVPRRTFARLIDVSERSLADLEKGKKPSQGVARRVTEVDRLRKALTQLIDANAVKEWLQEPNQAFDGLKPIEVIERGESDRIWQMVYYLESGMPS